LILKYWKVPFPSCGHHARIKLNNVNYSYHSTKVDRAQLGNSLVRVHVQVVHKFEYCLRTTWKLFGK
jgi:hypothetical protein